MPPTETTTNVHTLQLPVVSVQSLLDTAGSALAAPHLHPDAVAMLMAMADHAPRNTAFRLEFSVPLQDTSRAEEVQRAVVAQFTRVQDDAGRQLARILRNGRFAAMVGLVFVAILLSAAQAAIHLSKEPLVHAVSESLTVFAWVAMWRPAELLLYEHWPVRHQRRLAGRLAQAQVVLRAQTPTG